MRIFIIKFFLFCLFIGFHSILSAQTFDFVRAKVLDMQTGEPVVFATVSIKGKAKGVITNMDGSFRLPIEFKEAGESIEISSMGYEKKKFELQKLSIFDINIIQLVPSVLTLNEAVVTAKGQKKLSAKQIVQFAIEKIPENYPLKNSTTRAYYRDYQLDNLEYVNLNEALIEVYDAGFYTIDTASTKASILSYSLNTDFRRDTLAQGLYTYKNKRKVIDNAYLNHYGGNEFVILRVHDAIRNYNMNTFDFINNMKEGDIISNHSFRRLEDTYLDGLRLYTIEFELSTATYEALGIIYISKNEFAIHKLNYVVYDNTKKNNSKLLKNKGIKGKLIFEVTAEYKQHEDTKMYLNFISLHNTFRLSIPPKFFIKELYFLESNNQFVINFNNKIALDTDLESNRLFDFRYKGRKIKFEKIIVYDNSSLILYPTMSVKELNDMSLELKALNQYELDNSDIFEFNVKDIYDVERNLLNEWTVKDYNQFREFFTQEVNNNYKLPKDSLLMHMRKPIFENQSILKIEKIDEYWMNTPLKIIMN